MINVGDKVRDLVTGFEGIVVGKTEWINNCVTVGVKPRVKDDGTIIEAHWFDVPQLELIERNVVARTSQNVGGPEKNGKPTIMHPYWAMHR